LIPKKEREKMIDFELEISVSKQCKVLKLKRNFLFHSPKGESEENLEIMLLLDKLYFVIPFFVCL
jgi:putative transposase